MIHLNHIANEITLYNSNHGEDVDRGSLDKVERDLNKIRREQGHENIIYRRVAPFFQPPQQEDGNSCGVYVIFYAKAIAERKYKTFNQSDIDRYRKERKYVLSFGQQPPESINLDTFIYDDHFRMIEKREIGGMMTKKVNAKLSPQKLRELVDFFSFVA